MDDLIFPGLLILIMIILGIILIIGKAIVTLTQSTKKTRNNRVIFTHKKTQSTGQYLPYQSRKKLFSNAERSLLGILDHIAGEDYRVFGKVRLADIVKVKRGEKQQTKYFNRIKAKHVDFVICRPDDLRIEFVIELDDKSHERDDRKKRDLLVNDILKITGIPIVRIKAKQNYKTDEIVESIRKVIQSRYTLP